jgi:hypothetical protein
VTAAAAKAREAPIAAEARRAVCQDSDPANRTSYSHRYVPQHDAALGHLMVNEAGIERGRMIYGWLTAEQTTSQQVPGVNAGTPSLLCRTSNQISLQRTQ